MHHLLKLSLRPWKRSPYSQFFTSLAVGVLLFLASFLFWMQWGLSPVIDRLQHEQVITAYLDNAVEPSAETTIVDTIRTQVGAHAEIKMVEPEQFIAHLKNDYPELSRELEDLGPEVSTVVPRYVSVSGILPDSSLENVKSVRGVQSAESSTDRFQTVIGAFRALKWVAGFLTLGLCLALMTGLIHLGRTNAYLQQDAFILMKLMGASSGDLRTPSMISGLLVGLAGGILAACAWMTAGVWMAEHIRSLSPVLSYMSILSPGFSIALLALGLLMGAFAGVAATPSRIGRTE
jgi:cell division protein FtsX